MAETREGGVYLVGRGEHAKYVDANGKEVSPPSKKEEKGGAATSSFVSNDQRGTSVEIPYADVLAAHGFKTPEQIRGASDEELLDVDGIGPARLREIREATKE